VFFPRNFIQQFEQNILFVCSCKKKCPSAMTIKFKRNDPLVMPTTGETPQERLNKSLPVSNTPAENYLNKRGIRLSIAHNAGVRYDPDWNGRQAVIAPMYDADKKLCSVHGRYFLQIGNQDKMFTVGPGGGILCIGEALKKNPVIIVEGLFDALSLAMYGFNTLATVGRLAPWLAQACAGKTVILAFDGNKPGDATAAFYKKFLIGSKTFRLTPPRNSQDWNTALRKSSGIIRQFVHNQLSNYM
jgi:hypothetical protein